MYDAFVFNLEICETEESSSARTGRGDNKYLGRAARHGRPDCPAPRAHGVRTPGGHSGGGVRPAEAPEEAGDHGRPGGNDTAQACRQGGCALLHQLRLGTGKTDGREHEHVAVHVRDAEESEGPQTKQAGGDRRPVAGAAAQPESREGGEGRVGDPGHPRGRGRPAGAPVRRRRAGVELQTQKAAEGHLTTAHRMFTKL